MWLIGQDRVSNVEKRRLLAGRGKGVTQVATLRVRA